MKTKRILGSTEKICLFCGNPEKEKWEEYQQYYECDCKDAVKNREIEKKISELKRTLPIPKYGIVQRPVLIHLNGQFD